MSIEQDLLRVGAICRDNLEVFANETRDNRSLQVLRDKYSRVIFIPQGGYEENIYVDGSYRASDSRMSYENTMDTYRRVSRLREFYQNKLILDFGCGLGSFLDAVLQDVKGAQGIELQDSCRSALLDRGIACFKSLDELGDNSVDTVFLFHVFEHIEKPIHLLESIGRKLKDGGNIVVEVPSANDFLLKFSSNDAFKNFTLWSQHLVLHTRDSLQRILKFGGFEKIVIENVQRYPLSNHFGWLRDGKPGAHLEEFAFLNDAGLIAQYEASLAKHDLTDTLMAIATVNKS